ncbi:hypothetical protein BU16DRAFT_613557 [Lophium mytilinum]|uniref:Transcription factor domain-containing protein n=1 Tax=Lophium mytilinum TaxID=390894 RepID=A0A6A6RBC5_9PEZI|nr:hypothetical protein BU16DRAFT_613557 [Lophium mytilinum]
MSDPHPQPKSKNSTNASLSFINISTPEDTQAPSTRRAIHQHAMRDIGLSRRKPRKKRGATDIPLDLTHLHSVMHAQTTQTHCHASSISLSVSVSPYQPLGLGQGEIDPFLPYPVPLTPSVRELVAHIFRDDALGCLRALRDDWFPVGLSSSVAFQLVLSNSAMSLAYLRVKSGGGETGMEVGDSERSLKHLGHAIRGLSSELADEKFRGSDEAVGAVAGFLCHDAAVGQLDSWLKHREGLKSVLEFRGGIEAISSNKSLRTTISWVELRGAYTWDLVPHFPLPPTWPSLSHYLSPPHPNAPSSTHPILAICKQILNPSSPFLPIFSALIDLSASTSAASAAQGPAFWASATDAGGWPGALAHRLLSWRPLDAGAPSSQIEECARLACLLYIAPVWRKFGTGPVLTGALAEKLVARLRGVKEWGALWELQVWGLVMAGRRGGNIGEIGVWLKEVGRERGLRGCEGVLEVARRVVWIGDVFDGLLGGGFWDVDDADEGFI